MIVLPVCHYRYGTIFGDVPVLRGEKFIELLTFYEILFMLKVLTDHSN
jgi:hypothetical protein